TSWTRTEFTDSGPGGHSTADLETHKITDRVKLRGEPSHGFRAGGDVEVGLGGVAEPDAVAGSDFQVNRQVDGDGFIDAVSGCAVVAGSGGPDRSTGVGGAEG
ncbi:hypothetical protein, partial [Nocardia sp. NPDC059154]|uniref:hypothetical protein n=1 Tax=Nocardia sp. NPDC059154 TaxID=3346744 RepID=UPI00367824BA